MGKAAVLVASFQQLAPGGVEAFMVLRQHGPMALPHLAPAVSRLGYAGPFLVSCISSGVACPRACTCCTNSKARGMACKAQSPKPRPWSAAFCCSLSACSTS